MDSLEESNLLAPLSSGADGGIVEGGGTVSVGVGGVLLAPIGDGLGTFVGGVCLLGAFVGVCVVGAFGAVGAADLGVGDTTGSSADSIVGSSGATVGDTAGPFVLIGSVGTMSASSMV